MPTYIFNLMVLGVLFPFVDLIAAFIQNAFTGYLRPPSFVTFVGLGLLYGDVILSVSYTLFR